MQRKPPLVHGLIWCAAALATPTLAATRGEVFTNMQATVQCTPSRIVTVHNTADVQAAVREARRLGVQVKAAINGWQGSNDNSCVAPGGLQLETSRLNSVLAVDREAMQVRVQPGIKFWDFNRKMHAVHRLVLPVAQEYADVTLGGMLGNGTHGSSLQERSSSIQDAVVAVTLVDGRGEVRVLTGPDLDFAATNLGVLGVITELTLQLQPSFKVQARFVGLSADTLADDVLRLAGAAYATNITYFPGQNSYVFTRFDKVPADTPGSAHNGQTETNWFNRTVFPVIFKLGNIAIDDGVMCLLEQQRYAMKTRSYFTQEFDQPVDPAVGWVHEMTSFVCRDRCPFTDLPYTLEEIAIPLQRLPAFIRQAQQLFALSPSCLPLNGIYFRFGRASRGAIGMASGRDTAYVGMEYVRNPLADHYPRDFAVIQELEQILIKNYDGRPHWGKNQDAMFVGVTAKYPRWPEFEAFRQRLDPDGVFASPFYQRRRDHSDEGLSGKNCVVERSCYCHSDDECPDNYTCQGGKIDSAAHICSVQ